MQLNHFVRIEAKLPDGKISFGTGYLVAPGRVLTAAHVIDDAENIEIFFDRLKGESERASASCIWEGKGDLDAALLECELTDESVGKVVSLLANEVLRRTLPWESRGCALAAGEGSRVQDSIVGLRGTAYSFDRRVSSFEVEVEAVPDAIDQWSGISGSPVFVQSSIYGVIVQAPEVFRGERLHAVPIHALLAADGFASALGLDDDGETYQQILSEVRRLLESSAEACQALIEVAEQRGNSAWRESFGGRGIERLAEEICGRSDVGEALETMNQAHQVLLRPHGDKVVDDRAATAIEKILGWVVPLLYKRGLVYAPPTGGGGVVLRLGARSETIAELALAGIDGRAFRFRPVGDDQELPKALGALSCKPPDLGMDPTGERRLRVFASALAMEFLPEELRGKYSISENLSAGDVEDLCDLLNDDFEWRAKSVDEPLRRFFWYDSEFRKEHEPFLRQLGSRLPALHQVELQGGDERSELRLCRPLRDLLYRAHTSMEHEV